MEPGSRIPGDIFIQASNGLHDSGFLWIAAAYAVHEHRVLLVLHNRFHKWVPPGGHLQAGESLSQAALREFKEETGLNAHVVSAAPVIHPSDDNATADAAPFYVDVERQGFRKPALVHYFFVRLAAPEELDLTNFEAAELDGLALFTRKDLDDLDTFEQVRSLGRYALVHHPAPSTSVDKPDI